MDMDEFFALALRPTRAFVPADPSASLNAYAIATDAIRITAQDQSNREAIRHSLKECAIFSRSLTKPRRLTSKELKRAQDAQMFFQQLYSLGEAEAYANAVRSDDQY